jgi:hypothetical protein
MRTYLDSEHERPHSREFSDTLPPRHMSNRTLALVSLALLLLIMDLLALWQAL